MRSVTIELTRWPEVLVICSCDVLVLLRSAAKAHELRTTKYTKYECKVGELLRSMMWCSLEKKERLVSHVKKG